MRVLFLDIWGTLAPDMMRPEHPGDHLDRKCIRRVNRVLAATGAKVVVTSDSCAGPCRFPHVSKLLSDHGLEAMFLGCIEHPYDGYLGMRPWAIRTWLDAHPTTSAYAILDDIELPFVASREESWKIGPPGCPPLRDYPELVPHFVHAREGVTEEAAERCSRILRGDSAS